jgi:hypothetical protein
LFAFASRQIAIFSDVDTALNRLDALAASAHAAGISALETHALALRAELTADYKNDEDSIQRPGKVRENLQSLIGFRAGTGVPSAATLDLARRIDAEASRALDDVQAFFLRDVAAADTTLRAAGKLALNEATTEPPLDCASDDS